MMTQTLALLMDAYRELNAKKMFWIVLILNVLVVAVFAILGVSDRSVTVFWKELGDMKQAGMDPGYWYKYVFSMVVVGLWFTLLSTILALISTAGIFPEFMTSGAVDLYLAKPIGRLRLFLTKYVAGLLFVALQVTIFTVLSFLVLGIRGKIWEPGLFFAIPVVMLFFSYLYSVCVLLGTLTRSTIAALLLTLLAWFGFWAVDKVDRTVAEIPMQMKAQREMMDREIVRLDQQIAEAPEGSEARLRMESLRKNMMERRDASISPETFQRVEWVIWGVKSLVPKTRDTIVLLDRVLFRDKDLQDMSRQGDVEEPPVETAPATRMRRGPRPMDSEYQARELEIDRRHSPWWIIGTSLLFEAAMVALAAWIFCRRDY